MENNQSSPTKIKYCPLEDGSVTEMEDLLTEGFGTDENTMRLCRNCEGGQPEDHRPWIRKVLRAHDWSVCRLAVDTDTGRVAGVCLSDVGTVERPSRALAAVTTTDTEACRLVTGFLQQLPADYDVFQALGVQKVLHINIVVVDKRYRRQGISLELRRQSIELARQCGCQGAINSATSPFTRKALIKLGFHQERFLPYTKSVLADVEKVDLSACGPEDGGALMVCRL